MFLSRLRAFAKALHFEQIMEANLLTAQVRVLTQQFKETVLNPEQTLGKHKVTNALVERINGKTQNLNQVLGVILHSITLELPSFLQRKTWPFFTRGFK